MYIAALKQCLAMFFLLMVIPYAEERKYMRFYLLVGIAILFHARAFMFAVPPFLFRKFFREYEHLSAFILTIGLREGANLFARMVAYFEIAIAVTLLWMIQKLFAKKSARLVTGSAVVLYFGYFLFEFGIAKDFGGIYRASVCGN